MKAIIPTNPTINIDLDFPEYVRRREKQLSVHLTNGIPDYSFSLDAQIRSRMEMIGLLRVIGQALNSAVVPFMRQLSLMDGVAIGPNQFPEVYRLGEDCARILGIGIPQMYIIFNPYPNAWTYCTNDIDQIVIITSGLIQVCTSLELKSVIGHECGHIHNQHSVYNTIWEIMVNPLARGLVLAAAYAIPGLRSILDMILGITQFTLNYLFGRWHRCAEFTCDRAGLICCGDLSAALHAEGKLTAGSASTLEGFNPDEYAKQVDRINKSPLFFLEILGTHPLGPKRVKAIELFSECEVLYSWRPEMRSPDRKIRSKVEVDKACEKLVI